MNTTDVYARFTTPSGLQDHMLRVAGLVCTIRENWNGEDINWNDAIKAALLHDMGNVIKFDLDAYPQLLGDELPRLEFWRTEQKRLIRKYGSDDHDATEQMLRELKVNKSIRDAIQTKSFGNSKEIASSQNWPSKILSHCDLRVLPHRIGTLDERIAEFKDRLLKYSTRPDFPELIASCKSIEHQIQSSVSANLDDIMTEANADKFRQHLLSYEIS